MLSFAEFIEKNPKPRYAVFTLYFCNTKFTRKNFRSRPHFRRFQSEYPDLAKDLTDRITNAYFPKYGEIKTFTPHEFLLYRAYQIMIKYAGSDQELLQ